MPITETDVEKIAQLAHMEITPEELKIFAPQMADIVAYVEQLNEVATSNIEPSLGGLTPEGEATIPLATICPLLRWARNWRWKKRPTQPPATFACRRCCESRISNLSNQQVEQSHT